MLDSQTELLDKIQLGEDSVLELRAVRVRGQRVVGPRREELADELAAFANTHAGVLVLGVDDRTRTIEGIPRDHLDAVETLVREVLNDSIEPPLLARIVKLNLPDTHGVEQAVIRVDVPRSLFVHRSPGGYLQRTGSSKRIMSPDVLARLFQQRSQARLIRFEEQPVPDTTLADLAEPLWKRFLRNGNEPVETQLAKRGLLARDDTGEWRTSVAGVLMACRTPDRFLPGAYIEAASYRGTEKDANQQLDGLSIQGPLDEQIMTALTFVRRNQRVFATKSPARREIPQFSERAVFEALVNAVAHRDYSIHASKIRLFLFADRLELCSPGALPNTVTVETLSLRQATRNELITRLLSECPVPDYPTDVGRSYFLEKRGEGVPIILRESEKLSGRSPVYRMVDDTELQLTLFAATPERLQETHLQEQELNSREHRAKD